MERLTGRRDGRAYIVGCPDFALPKIAGLIIQQTVNRLASIEDILGDEYELEQIQGVFDEWHHYLKFASERNAIESTVSDIYGNGNVDWERLRELVEADREGRCVVLPCEPGREISYKSGIGLRYNAVIDAYTPANIFITAKTEIPNAEPLIQTFSILEVEAALKVRKRE